MSRGPRLVVDGVWLAGAPGSTRSVPALSLAVGPGECVALLAGDRSDATRLIDTLAGHADPAAGRIRVDDCDVTGLSPKRRRVGILSERDPLFGHLSIHDNLAFPLAIRGVRGLDRVHRVRQALALLGLEAQARSRPRGLDATLLVRAALARVLVCDAAVVLLDDPFGRIAPAPRRELQRTMRRLARARGVGLLLVTGDRDDALMMGDRIGILSGGMIRQLGSAATLLDRPTDENVAIGFGQANALSGHVEWISDDVAHVRLSAGPSMEAMAAADLAEGAPCVVCVRPERIAVAFVATDADPLDGDTLTATLSDMVHLGDHLQLRFRLTGGGEVLVRRPAAQPTAGLRVDHPARLAWQAVHANAFPMTA